MRSNQYAIPGKDAGLRYVNRTECELIGEHQGDAYTKDDVHGRWEEWTCCAEREFVGDLLDCDICLESGLLPKAKDMPDGWIEDTQGFHCPKCQAPGQGA